MVVGMVHTKAAVKVDQLGQPLVMLLRRATKTNNEKVSAFPFVYPFSRKKIFSTVYTAV